MIIYAAGQGPNLPEYSFYGGTVILRFDQSSWTYFKIEYDGSLTPQYGVTGVIHIIDKSEPLMRWAVKLALLRFRKLLLESYVKCAGWQEVPLPDFEKIIDDIIEKAKKADKEELDAAAEIGHIAHDWIENYIKAVISGKEERRHELLAKLPDDERSASACIAAVAWMVEHDVQWISTERKCYSKRYGYAGTMDGLARVSSCSDSACCPASFRERLTLVDWKTSNALRLDYFYQRAAYWQAYEEETGEKIEDSWIIRLDKETAEFDSWHLEARADYEEDFQGFLNALELYKSVEKSNDRISSIKDRRKDIERAARDEARKICCPDAGEYKGSRLKKGCNGSETMCKACTTKYLDKHPVLV